MIRSRAYDDLLPHRPCAWTREEDGVEWLIPGCMGTAIGGAESCTCDTPLSRIERAEEMIRTQAAHIERLRERLQDLRAESADMLAELRAANTEAATLRRRIAMIESAT